MYRLCALFAVALVAPLDASAQQQFPATLAGHAVLPALAIALDPPKDAPEAFAIAGKYTGPEWRRVDAIGTIPGTSYISPQSAPRRTGVSTPFKGQPMQGFSGIKAMPDGTFWVMTDNGLAPRRTAATRCSCSTTSGPTGGPERSSTCAPCSCTIPIAKFRS